MSRIVITLEEFETSVDRLRQAGVRASELDAINLKLEQSRSAACQKIEELGVSMREAKGKVDLLNKSILEFATTAADIYASTDVDIGKQTNG